jgi:hypothetical protein
MVERTQGWRGEGDHISGLKRGADRTMPKKEDVEM